MIKLIFATAFFPTSRARRVLRSLSFRRLWRVTASTLATLYLAACAVGPDHQQPDTTIPDEFGTTLSDKQDVPLSQSADQVMVEGLGDPTLAGLVQDALRTNYDLRAALAGLDRAQALLRNTRLEALPSVTAQGEAGHHRSSVDQMPGVSASGRDNQNWQASLVAGWELDVFGRVRRLIEAGQADTFASTADLRALQVLIVSEVMQSYTQLRGTQARLLVAQANLLNQQNTLSLVQQRLDAGTGTEFDTARLRAQAETTASRIPALQAQAAVQMHRLAVLTGRQPLALVKQLTPFQGMPVPARLDAGSPGELLRRRPDIAAAEARLHAATARIGVATADLFPRFTLGGLIGSHAIDSSQLFSRESETRLVVLGIDWSFLDVGRVQSRIAAADADAQAALARYRQTVLLALEETENALVLHARTRIEDAHLERAAADSELAARIARTRFEAGAAGLLEVLDAERTQLLAQDALAEARTRTMLSAVALYKALAGGWPSSLPEREALAARSS